MEFDVKKHLITIEKEKIIDGKKQIVQQEYLPVYARIAQFNLDYDLTTGWAIQTEIVEDNGSVAVVKAILINPEGKIIRTAHRACTKEKYGEDYLETAETQALGRLLSYSGYGTLYALELRETSFADAPIERKNEVKKEEPPFDIEEQPQEEKKKTRPKRKSKLNQSNTVSETQLKAIQSQLAMLKQWDIDWTLEMVSQEVLGKDKPETEEEAKDIISHLNDVINGLEVDN